MNLAAFVVILSDCNNSKSRATAVVGLSRLEIPPKHRGKGAPRESRAGCIISERLGSHAARWGGGGASGEIQAALRAGEKHLADGRQHRGVIA